MTNSNAVTVYDVVIIGSGPAGLTSGIYTARADLKTLCIAGSRWGGQLMQTTLVENFPGFPEGVQGPELMANMRKQAEKFGVVFVDEDVAGVEFEKNIFEVTVGEKKYSGKSVIIATGAEFNWLGLPSEQKLIGRGVSSCATCDAAFFRNKKVIVVGGGDAAMEEALVLSRFASEVTLIHRRGEFRASKIMQERVLTNPKIKVMWNTTVTEILGDQKVEGVKVAVTDSNSVVTNSHLVCDGVFVAIGHSPATKVFAGKIDLDEKGFIKRTGPIYKTMTNVAGVFTAGDVHDIRYKQAITAAGYGCEAALEVEKWLSEM